jgi:hypothetical protein
MSPPIDGDRLAADSASAAAQHPGSGAVAPNRALPTWAIDLLMFGVPTYTPATQIWGAAMRIAMCAQARGWSQTEYVNEFMSRTTRKNRAGQKRTSNHKLWEQVQAYSKHGNSGIHELDKAWNTAKVNRQSGEGLTTPEELLNNAIERAWAWETRFAEGNDGLSIAEASVMSYVIVEIERRQMTRVTCPCRVVGEYAKLPHATAARTLKCLAEKGFLDQFSRGTYSKDPSNRKAAIYSLSDPFNLRIGGRGGPSPKAMDLKAKTLESPRET